MIEVSGVSRSFGGIEALRSIDLTIPEGSFCALLGPNGAGKTTLMNILTGIEQAESGSVRIGGEDMAGSDRRRRLQIGLVPQKIALYPGISPFANLRIFGRIFGLSREFLRERCETLLHEVGLWDRRKDRVKDLSGGMQRRLNLAVSLLHEPRYLLCDEATVGIDPQSRIAIFEILEEQHRRGTTILYATHYMEEAERLCDRVAVIDQGRVIATGRHDALIAESSLRPEIRLKRCEASEALVEASLDEGFVWSDEEGDYVSTLPEDARLSLLYQHLEKAGLGYELLEVRRPSLESLFFDLTGRSLRE